VKQAAIFLAILLPLAAQAQSKSFVGTVTGFRAESAEVEVKPDTGDVVIGKLTPDTLAQKIAPGEKDLKKAVAIQVTDLAKGDRVLLTLDPGSSGIRRIVVMSSSDIAHRNQEDRLDWQKRGVAGVVSAKSGNQITLKNKTMTGEVVTSVTVSDRTAIKRYAPDSVNFADAQPAKLAEISVGDQVRARGQKSDDGLKVAAEDIVFGTFVIEAGTVGAIDLDAKEIKVKELGTNKLLTVKLTADSQLKQMAAMPPMGGRGGMPRGGGPPSGGSPGGGRPSGGLPGGRAGMPGGFDINQMIERTPVIKLEDLKPGTTVVITSTKGAKSDRLTAIMLLSNADMLIQMASAMKGESGGGMGGMSPGGMGGMASGDMSGLMGLGIGGMNQ
jgi:hypothetical protein